MPENVPATGQSTAKTTLHRPTSKRKTPRQVSDLPRGIDLLSGFGGQRSIHLSYRRTELDDRQLPGTCQLDVVGQVEERYTAGFRIAARADLFSIDTLIDMLAKLGIRAKVVLQPSRRRAGVA